MTKKKIIRENTPKQLVEVELFNPKLTTKIMICYWSDCCKELENLGHHLYVEHLENIPKNYNEYYCLWRNCHCKTVFKYKSHLILHLRDHVSGKLENETPKNERAVVNRQETIQIIPALPTDKDDAHYEVVAEYGCRISCPIQNCKQVTFYSLFSKT